MENLFFLQNYLKLTLHPQKLFIKTLASGIDFLGWTHFPGHRVLRRVTERRMMAGIKKFHKDETIQSYLGLLKHGNTYKLWKEILVADWLNSDNY